MGSEFEPGDVPPARGKRVRLLRDTDELAAGAEGVVVGFYAREERTVLVRFGEALVEVAPDAVEPVDMPA